MGQNEELVIVAHIETDFLSFNIPIGLNEEMFPEPGTPFPEEMQEEIATGIVAAIARARAESTPIDKSFPAS